MISNKRQNIFDDHKTWNLGHKKSGDVRKKPPSNKNDTNLKRKKLQYRLYADKKRLASLTESSTESDDNFVDPSNSIKGRKSKKKMIETVNEPTGKTE